MTSSTWVTNMKNFLLFVLFISMASISYADAKNYNTDDGYVAEGYDVVEYFNDKAIEGDEKYTFNYDGVKFKFSKEGNLNKFKSNPDKYVPQYGGWCAYAIADSDKRVSIDPETFHILDGKLYLFYNSFFINTLNSWKKEGPEQLRVKADKNWKRQLLKK